MIGCGSTATISTRGGQINGEIVSGDARNVYLQGQGGVLAVSRQEITDIDHPGNGVALAGGIVSAYGVFNIAVGAPRCHEKGSSYCVGVFTPLAIGLPLMIYGLVVYGTSVSAAKPGSAGSRGRDAQLRLDPAVFRLAGERASPGLVLGGRF
ncbi:MAG TPA: hypothetical protein VIF57_09350 [Polyangia bacterium]